MTFNLNVAGVLMEALTDLKAILHSKRANIYYLEHCRVMQKDGRVLYLTESKQQNFYWNIPIEPPRVSRRPNFLREYPNEKYLLT